VTGNFWLGAIVALLAGVLIGMINGLIVTRLKVNSLITTLGMYYCCAVLCIWSPNGSPFRINPRATRFFW